MNKRKEYNYRLAQCCQSCEHLSDVPFEEIFIRNRLKIVGLRPYCTKIQDNVFVIDICDKYELKHE